MKLLARASAAEIAEPLKTGGLYRHKSKRIQEICARLIDTFGRPTLAPLRDLTDERCESFLTSLPGVGLKVARCVMLYSFDREVFPVDTHCWRVCQRLGWVRQTKAGVCTRNDMNRLQEKIPPCWRFSLHVNLISLGRDVCTVKNPKCQRCPITRFCRRGRQLNGLEGGFPTDS
jgi:endonuclease-3